MTVLRKYIYISIHTVLTKSDIRGTLRGTLTLFPHSGAALRANLALRQKNPQLLTFVFNEAALFLMRKKKKKKRRELAVP